MFGFARLASMWFGALLGLYGVYALIAFFRLPPRFLGADRAIMVLGPTMMAVALVVSAATFAASAMRFDLLMTRDAAHRRAYWTQLVLFGLGAYFLVAFGAPAVRSLWAGTSDLPLESLPPAGSAVTGLRLLFPVSFGVFAVLSGIIGAFVGRITSRSVVKHAGAVPWLAGFGLVSVFTASFLGTSSLIVQRGFSSVCIIVLPLTVPLIVLAALVWREDYGFPQALFRPGGRAIKSDPIDPDSVDEVLSRVIGSHMKTNDPVSSTTVSAENDVVRLAHGIRRVAGSRPRMSPANVSDIVDQLVTQSVGRTQPVARAQSKHRTAAGELCSAGASLAAGCLLIGSIGGLMPSISSAVIVGIIGSAAAFLVHPRGLAKATAPE